MEFIITGFYQLSGLVLLLTLILSIVLLFMGKYINLLVWITFPFSIFRNFTFAIMAGKGASSRDQMHYLWNQLLAGNTEAYFVMFLAVMNLVILGLQVRTLIDGIKTLKSHKEEPGLKNFLIAKGESEQ